MVIRNHRLVGKQWQELHSSPSKQRLESIMGAKLPGRASVWHALDDDVVALRA